MFFGLDPGLLGGLALHWTSSAMAQSTIAFVTASVAGKTIKTSSFAQVSAEETYDDLLERTLPGGIPGASAVDIKIYKSSEDAHTHARMNMYTHARTGTSLAHQP